jgi:hypothetical protein
LGEIQITVAHACSIEEDAANRRRAAVVRPPLSQCIKTDAHGKTRSVNKCFFFRRIVVRRGTGQWRHGPVAAGISLLRPAAGTPGIGETRDTGLAIGMTLRASLGHTRQFLIDAIDPPCA